MKKKLLSIMLLGCLALTLMGCNSAEKNEFNNTEDNEENISYGSTEIINGEEFKSQTIGSSNIGSLTLGPEYNVEDVSSLLHTGDYFIATGPLIGISFLSSSDSPEIILTNNQDMESYDIISNEKVAENETYLARQAYGENQETGAYYSIVCMQNKNTLECTVLVFVNFAEMNFEDFQFQCKEVLKNHSYGLFKGVM